MHFQEEEHGQNHFTDNTHVKFSFFVHSIFNVFSTVISSKDVMIKNESRKFPYVWYNAGTPVYTQYYDRQSECWVLSQCQIKSQLRRYGGPNNRQKLLYVTIDKPFTTQKA